MPRGEGAAQGVLVADKPAGPTSHDVVDRVRKALGVRRVGHTGTLDPFATGVLPVCVGRATRLARFLAEGEKVYLATLRLGLATTTDDLMGEPLGPEAPVRLERAEVEAGCRRLTGRQLQVPPAFSAKRIGGRRAYDLARAGAAVAPAAVPVTVHALDVLAWDDRRLDVEVRCSSGTYVRALARDLGALLGVGAHLVALRRTLSGGFGIADAVPWEELETTARDRLVPVDGLLSHLPAVCIGEDGRRLLRHGRDLTRSQVRSGFPDEPPPRLRVLDEDGHLVALAVPRGFGVPAPGLSLEPALHPDVVLLPDEAR